VAELVLHDLLRAAADARLHLEHSRFLHAYDETLDGGLILPRGMLDTVTSLATQAGSRLEITDERTPGTPQEFTCAAVLTDAQREAVAELPERAVAPEEQVWSNMMDPTAAAKLLEEDGAPPA
jgi:hypothetical protein